MNEELSSVKQKIHSRRSDLNDLANSDLPAAELAEALLEVCDGEK